MNILGPNIKGWALLAFRIVASMKARDIITRIRTFQIATYYEYLNEHQ